MKKKILFMSTFCLALSFQAFGQSTISESDNSGSLISDIKLDPIKPTYLKEISDSGWGKNWFIEAKGGGSAFLGSPLGCGDLYDRMTPVLQLGLGKWFTPSVGGRIEFQGLQFKNADFTKMDYQFVHADFMYNLTATVNQNELGLSRWDVIPYIGIGMIRNADWRSSCMCPGHASGSHPFAFSYGVEVRYRLADRLHLVAEVSGLTTAKNFDAIGVSSDFGDNMLSLSAGLSFTLGRVGFKRVVDAKPYMTQNDWLMDYANGLSDQNRYLHKLLSENDRILEQYHKILEIEGLLDLYKDQLSDRSERGKALYPKNDYSGLNSLRARMANRNAGADADREKMSGGSLSESLSDRFKGMEGGFSDGSDATSEEYLYAMLTEGKYIGAPIYFFFHIGTDHLTEVSQILNIDEIAKVAKAYGLNVNISGAADSATGSEAFNEEVSGKRADYIRRLLVDRGIAQEKITTNHIGGTDSYSPVEANRNTCVTLSF